MPSATKIECRVNECKNDVQVTLQQRTSGKRKRVYPLSNYPELISCLIEASLLEPGYVVVGDPSGFLYAGLPDGPTICAACFSRAQRLKADKKGAQPTATSHLQGTSSPVQAEAAGYTADGDGPNLSDTQLHHILSDTQLHHHESAAPATFPDFPPEAAVHTDDGGGPILSDPQLCHLVESTESNTSPAPATEAAVHTDDGGDPILSDPQLHHPRVGESATPADSPAPHPEAAVHTDDGDSSILSDPQLHHHGESAEPTPSPAPAPAPEGGVDAPRTPPLKKRPLTPTASTPTTSTAKVTSANSVQTTRTPSGHVAKRRTYSQSDDSDTPMGEADISAPLSPNGCDALPTNRVLLDEFAEVNTSDSPTPPPLRHPSTPPASDHHHPATAKPSAPSNHATAPQQHDINTLEGVVLKEGMAKMELENSQQRVWEVRQLLCNKAVCTARALELYFSYPSLQHIHTDMYTKPADCKCNACDNEVQIPYILTDVTSESIQMCKVVYAYIQMHSKMPTRQEVVDMYVGKIPKARARRTNTSTQAQPSTPISPEALLVIGRIPPSANLRIKSKKDAPELFAHLMAIGVLAQDKDNDGNENGEEVGAEQITQTAPLAPNNTSSMQRYPVQKYVYVKDAYMCQLEAGMRLYGSEEGANARFMMYL